MVLVRGTFQDDVLDPSTSKITDAPDDIFGRQGNDIVFAAGGDDLIQGSSGNDELFGGLGADDIFGQSDNDVLYGNNGSNAPGDGDDLLDGGTGDDTSIGIMSSGELLATLTGMNASQITEADFIRGIPESPVTSVRG